MLGRERQRILRKNKEICFESRGALGLIPQTPPQAPPPRPPQSPPQPPSVAPSAPGHPHPRDSSNIPTSTCSQSDEGRNPPSSRSNNKAAVYPYEKWLSQSDESLDDFPIFFHYVNVGTECARRRNDHRRVFTIEVKSPESTTYRRPKAITGIPPASVYCSSDGYCFFTPMVKVCWVP